MNDMTATQMGGVHQYSAGICVANDLQKIRRESKCRAMRFSAAQKTKPREVVAGLLHTPLTWLQC
jgi:hypothetical protein